MPAVDAKHPLYAKFHSMWVKCRDTYEGVDAVKAKRTTYLPATSGMIEDGMNSTTDLGYQMYQAYLTRAVFHEYMSDAIKIALGAMHCKPPTIELPPEMEFLRKNATAFNESLDLLLRRINEQQLITGRVGLLMDLPTVVDPANPQPYFAIYNAESLINWDAGDRDESNKPRLNLVVLCETGFEREADFNWIEVEKYRVLVLGDPMEDEAPGEPAVVAVGIFERGKGTEDKGELVLTGAWRIPTFRGNTMKEVPFTIINSRDVVSDPDFPPLMSLAELALASYRGEADYRQSLFMQAQDTLVTVGSSEDDHRTGAGASINLKLGGEAYYIGVSADGLGEMRQALAADKAEANYRAGQMIDSRSRPFESGEALKTRQVGQTATLNEIAVSGAYGLEQALKGMAVWMGADPELVKVTPNLDFSLVGMISQELVELMTARTMGAPISLKTIHTLMEERGLTRLDYETELQEMMNDEFPAGTATIPPPSTGNKAPPSGSKDATAKKAGGATK